MVLADTTVALRKTKLAGVSTFIDHATSMTQGAESMLGQADMLGWEMQTRPLVNADGLEHSSKKEITRFNPKTQQREVMNNVIVGNKFMPIQLEQGFQLGDYLMKLGATPISAGTLQNGHVAWCQLDLQKPVLVGDVDELSGQYTFVLGNAGQLSLKGNVTVERHWCANQIPAEISRMSHRNTGLSIRHTASAEYQIRQAQTIMNTAHNWIDEISEIAEKLVNVPMQNDQFVELAKIIYPEPVITDDNPKPRSMGKWNRLIDELERIFMGDGLQGDTTGKIGGTAWCGYNALTERLDWYRTSQPDKVTGGTNSNLRTAQVLGVTGQTMATKGNILTQVEQFVDNLPRKSFRPVS